MKARSRYLAPHLYAADPHAHVFDGRLYIYPSHDIDAGMPENDNGDHFDMRDYHVFSMDDMDGEVTDHGVALDIKNIPWAGRQLWDCDCACKDGKYYLYFPLKDKNDFFRIGVATSDCPEGPFVAMKQPIRDSYSIDPAVFCDEDGDTLTYSKVSGSAWLNVASDGTLSGTPGAGDVGLNAFTVQVDDGNGGSDTASLEITVDAAVNAVHVDSITLSGVIAGGPNRYGLADVVMVDQGGQPVANATVTVTFSGDINEQAIGVTDAAGLASIQSSAKSKAPVSLTVTVDSASHASYVYDAAANVETSASGTLN